MSSPPDPLAVIEELIRSDSMWPDQPELWGGLRRDAWLALASLKRERESHELCVICTPERDHNGVLCRRHANEQISSLKREREEHEGLREALRSARRRYDELELEIEDGEQLDAHPDLQRYRRTVLEGQGEILNLFADAALGGEQEQTRNQTTTSLRAGIPGAPPIPTSNPIHQAIRKLTLDGEQETGT